jgi:prevent-host-death family protein
MLQSCPGLPFSAKVANIHTLKAHLSEYIEKTQTGERILVCKRNIPVAEIVPISEDQRAPRSIGLAKGEFRVPRDFNDPLADDEINAFFGS